MTTFAYDAAGNRSTLTHDNGTITTYAYNTRNWLTGMTNKKANDTVISSFTYLHDDLGNRTRMTENNGDITTWTYDNANQLAVEQRSGANAYRTTFTYDSVGNRRSWPRRD